MICDHCTREIDESQWHVALSVIQDAVCIQIRVFHSWECLHDWVIAQERTAEGEEA